MPVTDKALFVIRYKLYEIKVTFFFWLGNVNLRIIFQKSRKNSSCMDHIYLRACICSDYYREEDQLDTIYEENWPWYLNTHIDVEYLVI